MKKNVSKFLIAVAAMLCFPLAVSAEDVCDHITQHVPMMGMKRELVLNVTTGMKEKSLLPVSINGLIGKLNMRQLVLKTGL